MINFLPQVMLSAAFILLLPLLAMQITDEVNWDVADFAIAWILFVSTGFTYKLATIKVGNTVYRLAVGLALTGAFILFWVNGAVGNIGSENNDTNLMYGGVLAVGIIGTIIVRLNPRGMSRTMFAMAVAQTLVTIIALIAGMHQGPEISMVEILILNGFFVALFAGSAWLFRHAAHKSNP